MRYLCLLLADTVPKLNVITGVHRLDFIYTQSVTDGYTIPLTLLETWSII